MNTFAIFAFIALLVYTARATPCKNICDAQCTIQKETCGLTKIFGNLCNKVNGVCTLVCSAACTCADSCAAKCGENYAKCTGGNSSLDIILKNLNVLSCGIHSSLCSSTCRHRCEFNRLAGIVNSLTSMGGWLSGKQTKQ
ncbi:hypothetical protein RRG08_065890 [Elysia crispata]|uniref:Uncharacterized protein n=1 Tax=Elysia crispata TaxID=231223 RepID=A0AAE0YZJ3_9GAST|nr:hypothetical protein RRG08_065890 [Elysia crispata]